MYDVRMMAMSCTARNESFDSMSACLASLEHVCYSCAGSSIDRADLNDKLELIAVLEAIAYW